MLDAFAPLAATAAAFAVPCLVCDLLTGTAVVSKYLPKGIARMTTSRVAEFAARLDMSDTELFEAPRLDVDDFDGFHLLSDSELAELGDLDYDQTDADIAAWYAEDPMEAAWFFGDFAGTYDDEAFGSRAEYEQEMADADYGDGYLYR